MKRSQYTAVGTRYPRFQFPFVGSALMVVRLGACALLERMLELLRDLRIAMLTKGIDIGMPVDDVLNFATVVTRAIVLPVLRVHEPRTFEKLQRRILLNRPPTLP